MFDQISMLVNDTTNGLVPEHVRKLGSWILKQYNSGDKNAPTAMETDEGTSEAAETEKLRKRRAESAAARRAKIMAQMNAAQKKAQGGETRVEDCQFLLFGTGNSLSWTRSDITCGHVPALHVYIVSGRKCHWWQHHHGPGISCS